MANQFFQSWKLWEKLVFILACLLVLTILVGLLKLWYTQWRVRKYTAIEKLTNRVNIVREKSIMRSLSVRRKGDLERQSSSRYKPQEKSGPDVPFGIKALESGMEVEGVWDSRPNSRRSSMAQVQLPRTSSYVDIGRVEAQLDSDDSYGSLVASTTASQQFEKATSAEKLPDGLTPNLQQPDAARSRYPPHSFMRYDGSHGHKIVNTLSSLTPEGQRHSSYPGSYRTASNSSSSSRRAPGSSGISPGTDNFLRPGARNSDSSQPRQTSARSSSADSLNAMQHRRASQVAESGQLLPRTGSRRSESQRSSGEWNSRRSIDITDSTMHEPSYVDDSRAGFPRIQIIGSTPPVDSKMQAPYDADAEYMRSQQLNGSLQQSRVVSEPILATPRKTSQKKKRSSFTVADKANPQVLREVNSGFAVLRPGALSHKRTVPSAASPMNDNDTSPRRDSSTKRHNRKLQKRRPSQDSQDSSRKSIDIGNGKV